MQIDAPGYKPAKGGKKEKEKAIPITPENANEVLARINATIPR